MSGSQPKDAPSSRATWATSSEWVSRLRMKSSLPAPRTCVLADSRRSAAECTTRARSRSNGVRPARFGGSATKRARASSPYGSFIDGSLRSPFAMAWARLTLRTCERRAVHERVTPDRGAAATTGLPLLPVHRERALEVAALAVDVDVERVERRAALGQRLDHHRADVPEQVVDLAGSQVPGVARVVQRGAPEGLVGVDVADTGDERLVEQGPLDARLAAAQPDAEVGRVEQSV